MPEQSLSRAGTFLVLSTSRHVVHAQGRSSSGSRPGPESDSPCCHVLHFVLRQLSPVLRIVGDRRQVKRRYECVRAPDLTVERPGAGQWPVNLKTKFQLPKEDRNQITGIRWDTSTYTISLGGTNLTVRRFSAMSNGKPHLDGHLSVGAALAMEPGGSSASRPGRGEALSGTRAQCALANLT
jgi:hypothetical protein